MKVDPAIEEAIVEGAKAGVFWKAARLNPMTAAVWEGLARQASSRAAGLLRRAVNR
jgi:hypothetical protein